MNNDQDSITLGQLKVLVNSAPKPKQCYYDFKYDDEDTVLNELEEFYSYVEMPQAAENLKAWGGSFHGEWTKSPPSKRRAHVELLLESLEHKDVEIRFTNARRLLYILQGTFAETTSPEHQLHWIFENCKVVRDANGLSNIVEAMKIASSKHDLLGLDLFQMLTFARIQLTVEERSDLMEEITTEISVYLAMLYHLIEVFKGHDDFADELMSMDPPLPVYFFNVVSGLRDKSAKGYPVKKLLLVLWKTILSCCGGFRDLERVKKVSRELAGLSSVPEEAVPIKSSPVDMEAFHGEVTVKYPTFSPPNTGHTLPVASSLEQPSPVAALPSMSKLAEAYNPIPVRHHYHHDEHDSQPAPLNLSHSLQGSSQLQSGYRPIPQPATPAPSPPPAAPKPKKQQYQTDPSRPFLFPFSRTRGRDGDMMLVPFAIKEAEKLYSKHMYVSLALWQMWRTREEYIHSESGLEHLPGTDDVWEALSKVKLSNESAVEAETDVLPDIALLDAKIAEVETAIKAADSAVEKRRLKTKREDLMRLRRVEQIYSAALPVLSNWVLVLLKLLLAIVSASSPGQPPTSANSSAFPPGVSSPQDPQQPPLHPPTLDEIDVTRHREITTKAVSAILLLTLKWFKVSHVMKFHHLGQLLLDTNCLLLVMKMFGMQDVSTTVVSRADSPDNNFFRYCLLHFSKNSQPSRVEDNMLSLPRRTVTRTTILPNGTTANEEIDMLTEFSWRNFFFTINFAKVMQKLSKHRSHRIRMLVQYKSTAVLKRVLKVQHPLLQLHILKLIKSQVPYSGRRWRQTNMQVITSIYLNCRPDLRDEWLTGNEVDDVGEGQVQEQALRQLVKFYNTKRYGQQAAHVHSQAHKRSVSLSHHLEGLHPGPELSGLLRPVGTPNVVEADVFPPLRAHAPDTNIFLPYITEDIAFEEEYEEYLSGLGWTDGPSHAHGTDGQGGGTSAWHRLPDLASEIADGISDSESIVSIGELGDEGRDIGREGGEIADENLNNWEHMSPKTMAALTKSPAGPGARRSSSGSDKLRPVLPFGLDDVGFSGVDDEEGDELGPVPREGTGNFPSGGGVDEVEYAYGMTGYEGSPLRNVSALQYESLCRFAVALFLNPSAITSALRMREPSISTASPTDSTSQTNESSKAKLKRNRIILSCQPCHKRKQQCDRGHPCSRCVNRGCPDACTYEEPKELKKRKWTETVSVRDESMTVPRIGEPNPSSSDSTNNSESGTVAGLDVLLQLLQNTNTTNVAHMPQSDDLELSRPHANENAVQAAATALNQLSQQEAPDTQNPIAAMLQSFRGYATPMLLSELQRHFPNQKITTFLLSYYFDKSSAHWLLPVIHRPCFEAYYRTFSSGPLPPPIEFIALLAITCATALQFLPETDEDAVIFAEYPSGRQALEQRLVDFSRSVLFTCTEYPLSSLERIQALTLFSMYQWNEANTGECWYIATLAIRMAQTLSLNRDGTSTWRMRPEDAEIRRRLWWTLFTIDRCQCMEYRRPYIISEQHTDVALPMNLDQVDVIDIPDLTGKPVEEPTDSLFHLYQSQFQRLSGRIWDQCFSVTLPTYRVVVDLEEQLRKFELELPTSLRFQTTQTAVSRPYLSLQYQMLVLEITHNRMQLLRPFLFIHPTKDKDFEGLSSQDKKLSVFHKHARAICVTFCKRQLALLQLSESTAEPGHMTWSGLTLLAFKPALTLAIAIIMDTQNPENEEFEEWIAMAQGILIALKPYNALAKKALEYVDVIRKRTLFVLGVVTGRCHGGDPAHHATYGVAPPMVLSQRRDRATRMLSQPQPCLVDHLGREEASDPFWSTLHPGVFAGHFPGIESLSGPVSPQNLEQFLDSCLSMHSRLPHTFTF